MKMCENIWLDTLNVENLDFEGVVKLFLKKISFN